MVIRESAYVPAWWLPSPHLMTIFPALLRRRMPLATRRERVELADGDFVDLDWIGPEPASSARDDLPLVLVLHGLEGSIDSPYARGLLAQLQCRGWRAVLMHFRGCSGEPNRARRSYHSGETEDVRAMVSRLRAQFPRAPLGIVGYSLGGNVLLKYLGEEDASVRVQVAIAVSVPMMLAPCADRLQRGFSRVYDRWLLWSLRKRFRQKSARVEVGLDVTEDELSRISSLRAFDDRITGPLHGFSGADDYYARSSSRPYLARIRTPTIILHARDDPFMTEAVLPDARELSDEVTLELSRAGGHVGFVSGANPFAPKYWLEQRIPELLVACFGADGLQPFKGWSR